MDEFLKRLNDLEDRINRILRAETPLFWDGTNVGIGGTPNAKLDLVNGTIRARNGTNVPPTSGLGLELLTTGNVSYIQGYNRDTPGYLPLNIRGSGITLAHPSGALQLDISGSGAGATSSIEMGANGTGSRYAYIDLHGDDTYTDYSSRWIRENTGVNAATRLQHRGTGEFSIESVDSAPVRIKTASTTRLTVDAAGNTLTNNLYPGGQASYYLGWDGGAGLVASTHFISAGNFYPGNQGTYYLGLSGTNLISNTNIISAGKFYPSNQSTWGISWNGNAMLIDGNILVGAGAQPVSGGAGLISMGNTVIDFNPTTGNWTTGGTTLLLNASTYSTIGFHDSGNRVDFIRVGNGVMQIGYNGGWGNANIEILNNTGIGTTIAAANRLFVKGADSSSSTGALLVQNSSGTTLMQNRDDNVNQVGTAWVVISDESTKDDIAPLSNGLTDIAKLKPKKYSTKSGNHKTFGLVAQDVQAIFPDMVVELEDGILGLRYNDLIPVLVNAVIELNDKLDKLEKSSKSQNK